MNKLIDKINNSIQVPDNEYLGTDGLLHCSKCGQPTQTVVEFMGNRKVVSCICECRKKEMLAHEQQAIKEEQDRKRRICFEQTNMSNWTFENDDRNNPKISDAMKRYTVDFSDFKHKGKGLLLYGAVGTGKTFLAACVANRLIDNNYKVLMTNFAKLTNKIQGMFEGKQEYIESLNHYSLLIIDDLGAERKSEFMQEMVFNIIDSRYRSGLPMIITTNLTADEIKKPQEVSYQRIYDRIIERCFPIEVKGTSRRRQVIRDTYDETKAKLGL